MICTFQERSIIIKIFSLILIFYFFSANDVSSSKALPELFMNTSTLHLGYRISIFYFIEGEIAAPINHMK